MVHSGTVTGHTNQISESVQSDAIEVNYLTSSSTFLLTSTPTDIVEFIQRPVKLAHLSQTALNDGFIHGYEVMKLFLDNSTIREKLRYFAYLRCDFNVRITLTAPAYAYGLLASSYYYYPEELSGDIIDSAVYISGRNVVYQDLSLNQSVEIKIPYCSPYEYYDIRDYSDNNILPRLMMTVITPPLNALDGSNAEYYLTIYGWLSNVKLAIPTPVMAESLKESKDTRSGPISTVATAFSKSLNELTKVPVIGPWANTGSNAFSSLSGLAKAFGFSKPYDMDTHRTIGFSPYAMSQGNDQFKRLALDPNTTTDITTYDDIQEDALGYSNIICREGALTRATLPDTFVTFPVAPLILTNVNGAQGTNEYSTNLTPLSFGAIPFRYWRGTIIFTFRFIASKYHRARIRISWTPFEPLAYTDADYALKAQNLLVEIVGSTTVEFSVGWGSRVPYLPVTKVPIAEQNSPHVNGYVTLGVVDSILAPSPDALVYYYVTHRAGGDFEFMEPTTRELGNFHSRKYSDVMTFVTPSDLSSCVGCSALQSPLIIQSTNTFQDYVPEFAQESDRSYNTDVAQRNVIGFTVNAKCDDGITKKYHGEKYTSYRPLLKRCVPVYAQQPILTPKDDLCLFLPRFPNDTSPISLNTLIGGKRIGTLSNYIAFFAFLFRGWHGSMRFVITPVQTSIDATTLSVTQGCDFPYSIRSVETGGQALNTTLAHYQNYKKIYAIGGDGYEPFCEWMGQEVSVDIPWHCPFNWESCKRQLRYLEYKKGIYLQYNTDVSFKVSQFIGEDFNFVQYLGVPTLYYYDDLTID